MSDLDGYLQRELRRTVRPIDVADVSSTIDLRCARRARTRRIQSVALTVVVLAGTVGGAAMLANAFREPGPAVGARPEVRNGVIVYSEVRNARQHLWVVNADGTDARQLTTDRFSSDSNPAVSPDGHTVAFVRTGADGSSICTIGIDGTGMAELSPLDVSAMAPAWSPDGTRIAFAGEDGGIYIGDVHGDDLRRIGQRFVVTGLSWSPDGSRIAYSAPSGATGSERDDDLWITDVDGVTQVNITATPDARELSPAWSPDGATILFSRETLAGASLMTIAPDPDASPIPLTDGATFDQNPSWSPDGSRIVFDRISPASADVYTMRSDGTELAIVARNAMDPAWQPVPSDDPEPTPSPSLATPGDDLGLGFPVCNVRLVGGDADGELSPDFDGDGRVDTAYLATKMSDVGGCPQADMGSNILGIDVTGDGRIDAEYGPISCELDCMPFMAIDLDDDGRDELLVQQLGGAILGLVPYASLGSDPAAVDGGIDPLTVVPPGDPGNGLPGGEPVTFSIGGDEGFSANLDCRGSGEERVLVATTGQLDSIEQPTRWTIRRTTLRLTSEGLEVLDTETFDQLVKDVITPGSEQHASLCGIPFPPNPAIETSPASG